MSTEPITIHTSDSLLFKRCRRRWDFQASTRQHLEAETAEQGLNLWFGTGIHFFLEDYHGYRKFPSVEEALGAYYDAFLPEELPMGAGEALGTMVGMMEYYTEYWLPRRDQFKTVWLDGQPQVEVSFQLLLSELSEYAGRPVVYQGTFDRVVTDSEGRWWVVEYKTARRIDIEKLPLDAQITRYLWAAEQWYQREFEGVVYLQFVKAVPEEPRQVRGGFSKDKRQATTHAVYRKALIEEFGKVPNEYVDFLNFLAEQESPEGDKFIRWDFVRRPIEAKINAYKHIIAEGYEMLNPNLALYPNPTRDCMWDCPIRTICIAIEEGADWEYLVDELLKPKQKGEDKPWKKRIRWPQNQ